MGTWEVAFVADEATALHIMKNNFYKLSNISQGPDSSKRKIKCYTF